MNRSRGSRAILQLTIKSRDSVIADVLLNERMLKMIRFCVLLLLPVAWFTLAIAKGEDKASDKRPAVIIETMKYDNVDVVSIHTKGTRVLARSLTLEDGSTIKPYSNEVEIVSGQSRVRTRKLEVYAKLNIKQIDLVRIEMEPIQN